MIDFSTFISYIFCRDYKGEIEAEPFEEIQSKEYLMWQQLKKQQKAAQRKTGGALPKIDYSGYGMWRYNPIIFYRDVNRQGETANFHRILLKNDLETQQFIEGRKFAIMSPITYVGHNRTSKNARYLYAFAVDLDGVGRKQLANVLHQMTPQSAPHDKYSYAPKANIIVNSGHGLHLYYILDKPIPLYKENVVLLQKMKTALTNVLWNDGTTTLKDIQYQGIFQAFRIPYTLTKFGEEITAFHNWDAEYHNIREFNENLDNPLTDDEIKQLEGYKTLNLGVTIDEAQRKWPEWYEKVIVMGNKKPKKWHIKRDLYDWWLRRLRNRNEKIIPGHRYFCLLTLVIYAVKCDIDEEELAQDAYSLLDRMEGLTIEETNHFTEEDIKDALRAYKEFYCTFPRNSIEYLTGLRMPTNRRNYNSRKDHLEIARSIQQTKRKIKGQKAWYLETHGRPKEDVTNSKAAEKIIKWILKNDTDGTKKPNISKCARETGLDRKTVRKWINESCLYDEMLNKYISEKKMPRGGTT